MSVDDRLAPTGIFLLRIARRCLGARCQRLGVHRGGWEYPAYLITASLAQALLGEGAYALVLSSGFAAGRRTGLARAQMQPTRAAAPGLLP